MGEYRIGSASVGRTWFSIRGAPFDLRLGHHVATTKDQQFENEERQTRTSEIPNAADA
jgi:hypothetical protein